MNQKRISEFIRGAAAKTRAFKDVSSWQSWRFPALGEPVITLGAQPRLSSWFRI